MNYSNILQRYDEDGSYEYPSDYDYEAFEKQAREVWRVLQQALNQELVFENGEDCQDASFGSAIILVEQYDPSKKFRYQSSLRFSNFGNLVSITDTTMLDKKQLTIILEILSQHGYIYVPAKALDNPYDGVMKETYDFRTWWVRYFDWL